MVLVVLALRGGKTPMKPGTRIIWWGWRRVHKRPVWLARNLRLPGGNRLVFELGVGPVSIYRVVDEILARRS